MIKFVKFITYERLIYTNNLEEEPRLVCKGVPQGGVLSPLLFNIYIYKISQKIPKSVTVAQFADDIALYCKRSPFAACKSLLEKSIETIGRNLYDLGLELAPHKTVLLHFNKRNIKPGETTININNMTVKSSPFARFLGINFDYKLNFKEHIDQLSKKCLQALSIIKFLRATWWGAHPETLLIFYKSFVRSILDYGCFVHFPTQKN